MNSEILLNNNDSSKRAAELSQTDRMKFATQYQKFAYYELGFPFDLALLMDDIKILAFESGGLTMKQSASFTNRNQVYAYKSGVPFELALKFSKQVQIEALTLSKSYNLTVEQIVEGISNQNQLKAIEFGVDVEYAIANFHFPIQIYALSNFKLKPETAARFIYPAQVMALEYGLNADDALKIISPVQLKNLKSGKSLIDSISSLADNETVAFKIPDEIKDRLSNKVITPEDLEIIVNAVFYKLFFESSPVEDCTMLVSASQDCTYYISECLGLGCSDL